MNNRLTFNRYYFRQCVHCVGFIYYNYKLTLKKNDLKKKKDD